MKQRDRQHHVLRKPDRGAVVVEDAKDDDMTRSARGTVEHPGTNVKVKSGLNRGILATGRGELRAMLACKAPRLV